MLARARSLEGRFLPHGRRDVLLQLALFAAAYYAYRLVRGTVDGRAAAAFENARDLIHIERSLNFFIEPTVQAWANGKHWLIDFSSWMYVNSHFSITVGALIFLYLFHNGSFYFVRNMFMLSMAFALVGYMLYPTAPPRFMPEWGFSDSVEEFTGVSSDASSIEVLFNPFAAVPSMHVAFALMIGLPLSRLVRARWLKVAWLLYPLLVTWVVVATGNHFWLDAVLGAVVAAVSALLAHRFLARARPQAWAFRTARAEAAV